MSPTPKCPICGKPRNAIHRPFCSKRCQEVDLGRWFSGSYAVPAVEPPDDFDLESLHNEAGDEDANGPGR